MSILFYTKRSRISLIQALSDMDTGDEKRTSEVPTLQYDLWQMNVRYNLTSHSGMQLWIIIAEWP